MSPLKRIIALHKRRWHSIAIAQGLAIAAGLASVALLTLSGWFITAAGVAGLSVAAAQVFDYFRPGAGIRFFAFTRTVSRYFERLVGHDATLAVLADLRVWVFRGLLRQPPSALGYVQSGDVLSRLTGDIDVLNGLYLRLGAPAVAALITAALALLFLAFTALGAAAFLAVLLIFTGAVLSWRAARASIRRGPDLAEAEAAARAAVVDLIASLPDLQAYGADGRMAEAAQARADAWTERQRREARSAAFSESAALLLSGLGIIGATLIGLALFKSGSLGGAQAVMLGFAAMALFESTAALPLAFEGYGRVKAAAERVTGLVEAPDTAVQETGTTPAPSKPTEIRFADIGFTYPERPAPILEGFSARLGRGETLAVIGPSGIGKSTLADLLVGFWEPDAGRILIDGTDIKEMDVSSLRGRIAYLPQNAHLFSATVRENLAMAQAEATDDVLWSALDRVGLRSAITALPEGLDQWIGEGGLHLSGGEARRLALARTLIKPAPILILDEPATGIDPMQRAALIAALLEPDPDRLRLIITHEPHLLPDRPDIRRIVLTEPDPTALPASEAA